MSETRTEEAREGLARTEAGDTTGEGLLDEARKRNPPAAEAAEQEASEAPAGKGMSR